MPAIIILIIIIVVLGKLGVTADGFMLTIKIAFYAMASIAAIAAAWLFISKQIIEPRAEAKRQEEVARARLAERDRPLRHGETYQSRLRHRFELKCAKEIRDIARKRFFNTPPSGQGWEDLLSSAIHSKLNSELAEPEYVLASKLLAGVRNGEENELTFPIFAARLSAEAEIKKQEARNRGDHIKARLQDGSVQTGQQFERWCKSALEHQGWRVEETPGSGDQGVDLIGTYRGHRIVFQCKHYSKTVGNAAVQEVISGKIFYGAGLGVVITSGAGYSPSAVRLADSAGVVLMSGNEIFSIDQKFEWG